MRSKRGERRRKEEQAQSIVGRKRRHRRKRNGEGEEDDQDKREERGRGSGEKRSGKMDTKEEGRRSGTRSHFLTWSNLKNRVSHPRT